VSHLITAKHVVVKCSQMAARYFETSSIWSNPLFLCTADKVVPPNYGR